MLNFPNFANFNSTAKLYTREITPFLASAKYNTRNVFKNFKLYRMFSFPKLVAPNLWNKLENQLPILSEEMNVKYFSNKKALKNHWKKIIKWFVSHFSVKYSFDCGSAKFRTRHTIKSRWTRNLIPVKYFFLGLLTAAFNFRENLYL